MGELLVARSLKVAAVVLGAVVLNRLVRWLLRRLVRGLEHRYIQQPLESLRAKTPRALLASTDPLPSLRRSQRAEMIGAAVANVASVAIWLMASHRGAACARASARAPAGRAGIAGLVLSLSAQQMVRDFLSGIAMLMEDQYGPGDVVDAGPAKGVVERVGLRTTRLRAVDGIVWHVRNGEIERLGNESRDWARVLVDVEVARGSDLALAMRTVEQAAQGSPRTSSGSRSCWRPRSCGGGGGQAGLGHHPARGQDPPLQARRHRPPAPRQRGGRAGAGRHPAAPGGRGPPGRPQPRQLRLVGPNSSVIWRPMPAATTTTQAPDDHRRQKPREERDMARSRAPHRATQVGRRARRARSAVAAPLRQLRRLGRRAPVRLRRPGTPPCPPCRRPRVARLPPRPRVALSPGGEGRPEVGSRARPVARRLQVTPSTTAATATHTRQSYRPA